MGDTKDSLEGLRPEKDFFIGLDSDGCVFDSMDIKHKECFCPAFINHFDLQAAAGAAREVWEFVNLHSKTRGVNRFHGVIRSMELVAEREEVRRRGAVPPSVEGLREWVGRETALSQAALEAECRGRDNADLARALRWSRDVTDAIARIVRNLPPFPQVHGVLEKAAQGADLMVVSQTPTADLEREWSEHGTEEFVRLIAGQERGTKTEHLRLAAAGNYPPERILMVGDAPGDLKAAKANGALFFPVVPGAEERSWERLGDEALDRFFRGTFAGDYQEALLKDFEAALPERPPFPRCSKNWAVGERCWR